MRVTDDLNARTIRPNEPWATMGMTRVVGAGAVSYTHLRAHETVLDIVCRLLLAQKNNKRNLWKYVTYIIN